MGNDQPDQVFIPDEIDLHQSPTPEVPQGSPESQSKADITQPNVGARPTSETKVRFREEEEIKVIPNREEVKDIENAKNNRENNEASQGVNGTDRTLDTEMSNLNPSREIDTTSEQRLRDAAEVGQPRNIELQKPEGRTQTNQDKNEPVAARTRSKVEPVPLPNVLPSNPYRSQKLAGEIREAHGAAREKSQQKSSMITKVKNFFSHKPP